MQKLTWYFIGVYIIKGKTKLSEDKVKYVKYDFNCDKILQSIRKRVPNVHIHVNSNPCQGTPTTDRHSSHKLIITYSWSQS